VPAGGIAPAMQFELTERSGQHASAYRGKIHSTVTLTNVMALSDRLGFTSIHATLNL
jgi:hypothetical protein